MSITLFRNVTMPSSATLLINRTGRVVNVYVTAESAKVDKNSVTFSGLKIIGGLTYTSGTGTLNGRLFFGMRNTASSGAMTSEACNTGWLSSNLMPGSGGSWEYTAPGDITVPATQNDSLAVQFQAASSPNVTSSYTYLTSWVPVSAVPPYGRIYGSVNGQAKLVQKLYAPIRGLDSASITTGWQTLLNTFTPATFIQKYNSTMDASTMIGKTVSELILRSSTSGSNNFMSLYVGFTDNTEILCANGIQSSVATVVAFADWGVTYNTSSATTSEYTPMSITYGNVSHSLSKLYGSVNGQSKLIYAA